MGKCWLEVVAYGFFLFLAITIAVVTLLGYVVVSI